MSIYYSCFLKLFNWYYIAHDYIAHVCRCVLHVLSDVTLVTSVLHVLSDNVTLVTMSVHTIGNLFEGAESDIHSPGQSNKSIIQNVRHLPGAFSEIDVLKHFEHHSLQEAHHPVAASEHGLRRSHRHTVPSRKIQENLAQETEVVKVFWNSVEVAGRLIRNT